MTHAGTAQAGGADIRAGELLQGRVIALVAQL
jgi:hypothetical protein